MEKKVLKDGEPCEHKGYLQHRSHACEGCGRICGKDPLHKPNRYEELLSDLAKLSDEELRSFCLDKRTQRLVNIVLDYKQKQNEKPLIGKLKDGPFLKGQGEAGPHLPAGAKVKIIDADYHTIYGLRFKIEGCNDWIEKNCFEYVTKETKFEVKIIPGVEKDKVRIFCFNTGEVKEAAIDGTDNNILTMIRKLIKSMLEITKSV